MLTPALVLLCVMMTVLVMAICAAAGRADEQTEMIRTMEMQNLTDEQLAQLGWKWVARDHNGKVVSLTSDDNSDHKEQIMEWLGEGYTVAQIFE